MGDTAHGSWTSKELGKFIAEERMGRKTVARKQARLQEKRKDKLRLSETSKEEAQQAVEHIQCNARNEECAANYESIVQAERFAFAWHQAAHEAADYPDMAELRHKLVHACIPVLNENGANSTKAFGALAPLLADLANDVIRECREASEHGVR